ncbi:MAG: hypothetical protein KZQ81_18425 [Candidatus Thiodiazotropha sp. (ex Rostrolucina anterorostrata)]|nr:hypothetical protein [Candidatus Thiodiazotropha sp. (ex Rostrolucina anterorostrata)]
MNGTLRPPPGTYTGPIVISKPITLDGQNKVTIDGAGEGTVLTVRADNTTIKGLQLRGSGESYDAMDAGLMIEADGVLVEGNTLDNVLFGIHIKQGNENRGCKVFCVTARVKYIPLSVLRTQS